MMLYLAGSIRHPGWVPPRPQALNPFVRRPDLVNIHPLRQLHHRWARVRHGEPGRSQQVTSARSGSWVAPSARWPTAFQLVDRRETSDTVGDAIGSLPYAGHDGVGAHAHWLRSAGGVATLGYPRLVEHSVPCAVVVIRERAPVLRPGAVPT